MVKKNKAPSQFQPLFAKIDKLTLKLIWKCRGLRIAKSILKKKEEEEENSRTHSF